MGSQLKKRIFSISFSLLQFGISNLHYCSCSRFVVESDCCILGKQTPKNSVLHTPRFILFPQTGPRFPNYTIGHKPSPKRTSYSRFLLVLVQPFSCCSCCCSIRLLLLLPFRVSINLQPLLNNIKYIFLVLQITIASKHDYLCGGKYLSSVDPV